MTTILARAFGAQDAMLTIIRALEAFDGVKVDLGAPLDLQDEHAWVSCVVNADVDPASSELLLESTPDLGVGVAVTQQVDEGEDWSAIRARLSTLCVAFEGAVQGDSTASGTCSLAYAKQATVIEQVVDPGESRFRLTAVYVLHVDQYIPSG